MKKLLFYLMLSILAHSISSKEISEEFCSFDTLVESFCQQSEENDYNNKSTDPPPPPVRSIAEWEPMEGVLIRYPFGIPYEFIALLSEEINVITIVNGQIEEDYVTTQYINNGVNLDNCYFLHALADTYWTRDYGPLYCITGENVVAGVDYKYRYQSHNFSDSIPIQLTEYLGIPYYKMPDILFDGTSNYMTDGMGVAASSSYVLTLNPDHTQPEIEMLLNDFQGIDTYHVLPQPPAGHHIDTWAKFLAPDKILIRKVSSTHSAYSYYEAAAEYFESQVSSYGRPYKIYRVNSPNNEPYTNSLILNNRVFVPITGNRENDAAALAVYQTAMPGYEIHGVTGDFHSGDAIHCRTQEVADRNMLHIYHQPISKKQFPENNYLIEARIIPLSGEPLYEDSIRVNYRVDNGEFYSVIMTQGEEYWYEANIPMQDIGSEISYYISAADHSGKSENHPYIGKYDPHKFNIISPLVFIEADFDDSVYGNNNGLFEPGETVEITAYYKNKGQDIIHNIKAYLNCSSQYITVHPPGLSTIDSSIEPNESVVFSFIVSSSLATPYSFSAIFDLEIETYNYDNSFDSFEIEINAEIIEEQLINESFENWLPDGWEATSTSGQINWQHSQTNLAGGEQPEAIFFWDPSTEAVQRLITPILNTADFSHIYLEFKHYIEDYESGYILAVEISEDGGSTWTKIMEFPAMNMPATLEEILIDNDEVGSEEFRIAWKFDGDSWDITSWNIDDVIIDGINLDNYKIGFFEGEVSLSSGDGNVNDVLITADDQLTYPNETGYYSLAVLEGNHNISASLSGYETITIEDIFIAEGDTINVDFLLDFILATNKNTFNISMFPNPARDKFFIISDEKIKHITLSNISGQKIKSIAVDDFQTKIKVNNIKKGIYFIQIQTINRQITEPIMIIQ